VFGNVCFSNFENYSLFLLKIKKNITNIKNKF
jgi:hypothetical protein